MPFEQKKTGEYLAALCSGLTYGIEGNIDVYYVALQAQEIVVAYCKELKPDNETIDYIRGCYIVTEYESVKITYDGEKYLIE